MQDDSVPTSNEVIPEIQTLEVPSEQDEDGVAPTDRSPPLRVRSLRDIYEQCSFALSACEPESVEEAQKHAEWREAMQSEWEAIQKNKT